MLYLDLSADFYPLRVSSVQSESYSPLTKYKWTDSVSVDTESELYNPSIKYFYRKKPFFVKILKTLRNGVRNYSLECHYFGSFPQFLLHVTNTMPTVFFLSPN